MTMTSNAPEFFARLLNAVTEVHVLHFLQTGPGSFARHMALGDLYDGLQDQIDGLVEAWQGCTSTLIEDYPFDRPKPGNDALAYVTALYEYIEAERAGVSDESHIQNQIDEICSLVSTTKYKLERLQ